MEIEAGQHLVAKFLGMSVHMDTLITMWIVMVALVLFSFFATRNLSIVPGKLQAVLENIMSFFWGLSEPIGHSGKKHTPLLASLFLFILTANLIGQIPWRLYHLGSSGELASPTNDINMTAAMALLVLFYYIGAGVLQKGPKYFLHYFKPIPWMAPINLMEDFVRPLSLAVRLFANILAGEILIMAILGLGSGALSALSNWIAGSVNLSHVGILSVPLSALGSLATLPFMFFEVFVAVIQALVFTLLSTAYLSLALEENH